jgi:hypothetical protein
MREAHEPALAQRMIATIRAPRRLAAWSAVSMRGWLLPGFWPITKIASASAKSSSPTVPLPTPITGVSATPLDS